jgi:hypothetical protein
MAAINLTPTKLFMYIEEYVCYKTDRQKSDERALQKHPDKICFNWYRELLYAALIMLQSVCGLISFNWEDEAF